MKKPREDKKKKKSSANAGGARARIKQTATKKQATENVSLDLYEPVDDNGKKVKKDSSFLWLEMWIDTIASIFVKDRGTIPHNIDDKIYVGTNLYMTKNYMSLVIRIDELGTATPETFFQFLTENLRDRGCNCVVDYTIRNQKWNLDLENSGLGSRIILWERVIEDEEQTKRLRERAARCLYTVDIAKTGQRLNRSRMFLTLRAKTLADLNLGEKLTLECLSATGAMIKQSFGDVQDTLEFMSLVGSKNPNLKDLPAVITSNQVLSQIVPNCGSMNDKQGYYIGMNVLNGSPYYIDFSTVTSARNMYVVAPSGVGKTVLAITIAQSAYENGSACCFMDIKGNEYSSFVVATGGVIVSLRPTSTEYINSWIMHAKDVVGFSTEEISGYFKSRLNFSKQQFLILSGLREKEDLLDFEELLDEFHQSLYITYGVIDNNVNSWEASEKLTPYVVFEHFMEYLTPQKQLQFGIKKSTIGTLAMYFSKEGSKSYVFNREFDYSDILNKDTISFDFGLLSGDTVETVNEDLFRLKFLYMSKLNGDFVKLQYSRGRRTFKILEESQVVSDEILKMYVEEYTLRRAQGQDTLLLGNSVQALMNNTLSQPLIENTRGLFVGELTSDALKIIEEQFDLKHLEEYLKIPGSEKKYKNTFFFVNKMQEKANYPILSVILPPERTGKNVFKIFKPTKEASTMGGK